MTAAPPLDLAAIFTPTTTVERVHFNGLSQEEYEAREAEKKIRRQRMRAMLQRAGDPETENRELWSCIHCFTPFKPGDAMWLTYSPHDFKFSAKCGACRESLETDTTAPIKRSGMVRNA